MNKKETNLIMLLIGTLIVQGASVLFFQLSFQTSGVERLTLFILGWLLIAYATIVWYFVSKHFMGAQQ